MDNNFWIIVEITLLVFCIMGAIACFVAAFFDKPHCLITSALYAIPAAGMLKDIVNRTKENRK